MAIYQYGEITVPEIPASNLPYVVLSMNNAGDLTACFSPEPFIAIDVFGSVGSSSLLGNVGYDTCACTPESAEIEVYKCLNDSLSRWNKISTASMPVVDGGGSNKGGESGVKYYECGYLSNPSWCNSEILFRNETVVCQTTDRVLVKETFPIQEFTTFLLASIEASKSLPMPGSGGDS